MLQLIKTVTIFIFIGLMMGCAGYNFETVETNLNTGNPKEAYDYLKKNAPKKQDIPYACELALIAHYANLFTESNELFQAAESIAEDRYTKSISKEALSIVTTDQLLPYSGTQYERLISHYYHALNYIYQNKLDDAMVECRRATNLIQYFKNDKNYDYLGAGFLAHFSGTVFEAAGEWNDAYISYKQAAEYFKNAYELTAVETPKDVGYSLVRISRILNFSDEYERYRELYGDVPLTPQNHGELILFYETGYVPRKKEESLTFPILTTDKFDETVDAAEFASTLRGREGMIVDDIKLEYLLRVAIPAMRSKRPNYKGITVSVQNEIVQGELIGDVEIMAMETFMSKRPMILIKTLARALVKYLATKRAEKENEVLGLITNLAGVITERADTRSWRTLPNQIYMVRVPLPEGNHELKLSFLNANGEVIRTEQVPEVTIISNEITFRNYRTYD